MLDERTTYLSGEIGFFNEGFKWFVIYAVILFSVIY